MSQVNIEDSWKQALGKEFEQPYFQALTTFVRQEITSGKTVYPPGKLIFNAFDTTPFEQVKVVILGQDPYHNPGEAMGLCFSVPKGVKVPPSLQRIYKEMHQDVGFEVPSHGDLTDWAKQGVFLLNAILTVEKKKAASHRKKGWEQFTDAVISTLSKEREHLVFMLWGNFAKSKASLIDASKHLILQSVHPSPLAGNAFFGNRHFSQANQFLKDNGLTPIDWSLPKS